MNLFDRLIKRLTLTQVEPDCFVGGAGEGGVGAESRLFGGLVAAQATMAAINTTDADVFAIHSLHAYFLAPGRPDADIEFRIMRSKQGRNFHVRNVMATQNGRQIFQLQASFQKPLPGVAHQQSAPSVPGPDQLPNRDALKGRKNWQEMPIDVRMGNEITADQATAPEQNVWLKANGNIPDDPKFHIALVVYASDRSLLDTAWRPHADKGRAASASLDHAIWFHAPPQFDDWILYSLTSPVAADSRGLAFGAMYDPAGRRIATVAQEGVLRVI